DAQLLGRRSRKALDCVGRLHHDARRPALVSHRNRRCRCGVCCAGAAEARRAVPQRQLSLVPRRYGASVGGRQRAAAAADSPAYGGAPSLKHPRRLAGRQCRRPGLRHAARPVSGAVVFRII
ncbi:hypothetical protein GGI05_004833, partial [Coemansia sp. RSA 2603]